MPVAMPPVILEVYYAPWCAPCALELPSLARFAAEKDKRLRIVIVSEPAKAMKKLRAFSPKLADAAIAVASKSPRETLFAAGDRDSILPYARSLSSTGTICARWRGVITLERAEAMVWSCRHSITAPYPQRS